MSARALFDLNSIFSKNHKIFLYFGFWKPNANWQYKTLYNFYTLFCFIVLILFLLPQLIYMLVNGDDVLEVTGTMYVFCTFFITLVKTCGIYFEMDKIQGVLKNFENNALLQVKTPDHLHLAHHIYKKTNYLLFYGFFLGFGTQLFWTLKPLLNQERTLPIKGWYPYNVKESPHFELTVIFQNMASAFNIIHTLNIDSFSINLMMECDFLRLSLENLSSFTTINHGLTYQKIPIKSNFQNHMTKNLKACVKHYIEIKRVANTMEDIYRSSMAVLFLGGAFIFCTILYQLLLVNPGGTEFFYLMFFLFSMLTEQFIFCWFGNELTFKSSAIYHSVLSIPSWTECDLDFRKSMVMMMVCLKKPIVIRAGYIIPLSMGVFVNVLRTSYSYLTLLKSF